MDYNNFLPSSSFWLGFYVLNMHQKQPNLIVFLDKSCKLLAIKLVKSQVSWYLQQHHCQDFKSNDSCWLMSEYEHNTVTIIQKKKGLHFTQSIICEISR
jgi:hypothetical protein